MQAKKHQVIELAKEIACFFFFFNRDFVSPSSDRPSHYLSGNNEDPTWFWK